MKFICVVTLFNFIFLCSAFANAAINRLRADEHHQINKLGF